MADDRPILVLTASAGSGHTTAAQAIVEELRQQVRRVPIEMHDTLTHTNAFFRTLYARGYLGLVNYAPTAMGMLYEATDRPARYFRRSLRGGFQNLNAHRFMRFVVQRRPRLIINTHFLPAEIVAYLRRKGRLECPQATVTTDFETHRLWAQSPTERYYTATDEGRQYLSTWGVDPASIRVTGIPVRAAFERPLDRAAARAKIGVDLGRPMVLLLCGGFGVGPTEELLRELAGIPEDAQITVIAGRNEPLRAALERAASALKKPIRVVGFTDAMHDWMRAADLAVTKPGGLTTAEALVCGLPLVIVNPIPGQESRNSDYLLEHGAAIKVNNLRMLGFRVGSLIADPARLSSLQKAALRIARPGAAAHIVADAISLM
ncbi:MAG: glycosyltransferase [Planctomycetes bacterium]|nr:glycosyltransferase [Planctomycetota bacterium]